MTQNLMHNVILKTKLIFNVMVTYVNNPNFPDFTELIDKFRLYFIIICCSAVVFLFISFLWIRMDRGGIQLKIEKKDNGKNKIKAVFPPMDFARAKIILGIRNTLENNYHKKDE